LRALLAADTTPLLADAIRIDALSGMRREEMAMLRVGDCVDGLFSITAGKTAAAVRQLPIHSDLVAIVARRCAGKNADAFLFEELGGAPKPGSLRGRGSLITQKFERLRTGLGIVDKSSKEQRRSRVNFHSLRKFFISQAEKAGIFPWTIAAVVGHKCGGMTLGKY
jgi:integrase